MAPVVRPGRWSLRSVPLDTIRIGVANEIRYTGGEEFGEEG